MPKFRKKPVVIEAMQFTDRNSGAEILEWSDWRVALCADPLGERIIEVPTLEGTMTARINDWIIRGIQGELYPCKPEIFAAIYEPAGEPVAVIPA